MSNNNREAAVAGRLERDQANFEWTPLLDLNMNPITAFLVFILAAAGAGAVFWGHPATPPGAQSQRS